MTYLDVKEGSSSDIRDGRAHLLPRMDNIHSERIHGIAPYIVTVHPRDQDFALVVVHEQAPNHLDLDLETCTDLLQTI